MDYDSNDKRANKMPTTSTMNNNHSTRSQCKGFIVFLNIVKQLWDNEALTTGSASFGSPERAISENILIDLDQPSKELAPIFVEPNTNSYKQIIAELRGINFYVGPEANTPNPLPIGTEKRRVPDLMPITIEKPKKTVGKDIAKRILLSRLYSIQLEPHKVTQNIESLIGICGSDFGMMSYE